LQVSLVVYRTGVGIATSEAAFGFHDSGVLAQNLVLLLSGALLAFMLELSEFLVVCHSSGLTLSVAGIFKVRNNFVVVAASDFKQLMSMV